MVEKINYLDGMTVEEQIAVLEEVEAVGERKTGVVRVNGQDYLVPMPVFEIILKMRDYILKMAHEIQKDKR